MMTGTTSDMKKEKFSLDKLCLIWMTDYNYMYQFLSSKQVGLHEHIGIFIYVLFGVNVNIQCTFM